MIGYFPTPQNDETLYSLIARYKQSLGYQKDAQAWNDFGFSKSDIKAVRNSTVPPQLLSKVPTDWFSDLDIETKHTLNLLQTAFHRTDLLRPNQRYTHSNKKLGFVRFDPHYCEQCAKEETATLGFSYWHRLHQLNGVFVCHKHQLYLSAGETIFVSELKLPEIKHSGNTREFNASGLPCKLLLKIARDSEYLIANPIENGREQMRLAFKAACDVLKLNSAKRRSSLVLNKLLANTYSSHLMKVFHLPKVRDGISWTASYSTQSFRVSPVTVLLGLYAMGLTVDALVKPNHSLYSYSDEDIARAANGRPIIGRLFGTTVEDPICVPNEISSISTINLEPSHTKKRVSVDDPDTLLQWEHKYELALAFLKKRNAKISKTSLAAAMRISLMHLLKLLNLYPHLKERFNKETSR